MKEYVMSHRQLSRTTASLLLLSCVTLLHSCAEFDDSISSDDDQPKDAQVKNATAKIKTAAKPKISAKPKAKAKFKTNDDEDEDSDEDNADVVTAIATPKIPVVTKPLTKEERALERGFYHNAKTNLYYSSGRSGFSVRVNGVANAAEEISVSVNDGAYVPYTGKLNFTKEGLNRLRFRATDSLGNWSPLQDFRIFVDKVPPMVNAFWQGTNYKDSEIKYVSGLSLFTVIAHDENAGIYKIMIEENGNTQAYQGPMKFSEGKHSIVYYAIDNVGNRSAPTALNFQVDSVAPTTKAVVRGGYFKGEHETFVNGNAQIILESGESVSGVARIEYMLNGGPVSTYQAPFLVADQKMEIKFRGIDQAGNQEAWKSFVLQPDSTPPEIQLDPHGNFISKGNIYYVQPGFSYTLAAKDKASGIGEVGVSFDGKPAQQMKDNKIVFDKAGDFHFSVRASDHVENVIETNPYVVIVDTAAPVSHLQTNARLILKNGIYYTTLPSHIEIASQDAGGVGVEKIEFSYDNKAFVPYSGAIDASQWPTKKRTLYFRGIDSLKNIETTKSAQVQIQTEGPKVDLMVESEDLPEVSVTDLEGKNQGEKKPAVVAPEEKPAAPATAPAPTTEEAKPVVVAPVAKPVVLTPVAKVKARPKVTLAKSKSKYKKAEVESDDDGPVDADALIPAD